MFDFDTMSSMPLFLMLIFDAITIIAADATPDIFL